MEPNEKKKDDSTFPQTFEKTPKWDCPEMNHPTDVEWFDMKGDQSLFRFVFALVPMVLAFEQYPNNLQNLIWRANLGS